MDLTYFVQNKSQIEVAEKVGLYCASQSHIPPRFQAFRCGLAGRNAGDADPMFRSAEETFASRMATYLSAGWLPTDGKIWVALTAPRQLPPPQNYGLQRASRESRLDERWLSENGRCNDPHSDTRETVSQPARSVWNAAAWNARHARIKKTW